MKSVKIKQTKKGYTTWSAAINYNGIHIIVSAGSEAELSVALDVLIGKENVKEEYFLKTYVTKRVHKVRRKK